MELAANLRRLRTARGMTQSALAEQLGVSDRAVSRWERGASLPDVTMLSRLALTLGTSTDALLGVDPQRMQAEILRATEECTTLLNQGDAPGAVKMLRAKSAIYPNQPELMVYLARALLALKTEDAAREALTLCRAAASSGTPAGGTPMRLSTIFGCKQVMAHALHRLGKPEQAAQLVEDEMPALWVSRELLLPRFAPPERAERIRRSNVGILTGLMTSTLHKLSHHGENPAFDRAAEQIQAIVDDLAL